MLREEIRVLIVEDDFLVREMIRGILDDLNYVVAGEAENGQRAIEMTQTLKPDVILMDIEMPDTDGIQATEWIYENCPTPVVVLTAYETEELIERVSASGAGAYLVKPPNAREVERTITIAIARFNDIMELRRLNGELQKRNAALQEALDTIKTLSGLVPICAWCGKRIRDENNEWQSVDVYISEHTDAQFTHGMCPDCEAEMMGKMPKKKRK